MIANWPNKYASPELLAKIADIIDSAIVITRAGNFGIYDHKIIYVNQAYCRLTGFSQQELIGRSPDILCDQKMSADAMMDFYNNCREGHEFRSEFVSYRRDGGDFNMKISVAPLVDELTGQAHFILNCAEVNREQKAEVENYNFDISPLIAAKNLPEKIELVHQEVAQEIVQEVIEEISQEIAQQITEEVVQEIAEQVAEETVEEIAHAIFQEIAEETPQEVVQVTVVPEYPQQVSQEFMAVQEQIQAQPAEKKSEISKILEEVQAELARMRAEPERMQAAAEAAAKIYNFDSPPVVATEKHEREQEVTEAKAVETGLQESSIQGEEEIGEFELEEFFPKLKVIIQPEINETPAEEARVEEVRAEEIRAEEKPQEEEAEEFREMTLEEIIAEFAKNQMENFQSVQEPAIPKIAEIVARQPIEETAKEPVQEKQAEDIIQQVEQLIQESEENIPARATALESILHSIEMKTAEVVKANERIQEAVSENVIEEPIIQDLEYFAKSQFLSNMSHDLRTPLNAIIGFAEVIRDQLFGPIDNPRYLSYANDIYKSGQELLGTISEIMELSEVEVEDASLEEGEFDLNETLDSVVDLLSARAFQTDVKLIKRMAGGELRYTGDRRKLKQAFAGALGNAIKYSPSGGKVEITSRMDEENNFELVVYLKSANMIATRSSLGSLLGTVTSKVESEYPEILMARRFTEAHGGKFSIFNSATSGTEIKLILPGARIVPNHEKRALFRVVQ